jgi:Serine dehydrogenase proteinase
LSRDSRLRLIREIEAARGSRLLVAVWGDRQNLPTIMAPDAPPVFFDHLERIGKVTKLDVLLYTVGGHTLTAWGLANLIREYCDQLGVFIPHRALSAGTLFVLAADEIIMSRVGQLSPVDPSINSPLGPKIQVPNQPNQLQVLPISVEDVIGFIDLATKCVGLKEEKSILSVFDQLSSQVHPLALGAVYRSREQIIALADKLLSFHMKDDEKKEERERIVTRLTRELGSHDYFIGRSEAKMFLKLNVIDVASELERKMLDLFREYSEFLDLRDPYNAEGFLGAYDEATGKFNRAIVETAELTHVFKTIKEVKRVQVQIPGEIATTTKIEERPSFEGWVADENV